MDIREFNLMRKKYDHPESLRFIIGERDDQYCVGGAFLRFYGNGAFLRFYGNNVGFPSVALLASYLHMYSPCSADQVQERAGEIIRLNDLEEFERAWEMLALAVVR